MQERPELPNRRRGFIHHDLHPFLENSVFRVSADKNSHHMTAVFFTGIISVIELNVLICAFHMKRQNKKDTNRTVESC